MKALHALSTQTEGTELAKAQVSELRIACDFPAPMATERGEVGTCRLWSVRLQENCAVPDLPITLNISYTAQESRPKHKIASSTPHLRAIPRA